MWEKLNLVTLNDGSDKFKCSKCGFEKKYFGLFRDQYCPKCKFGKEVPICGCWTTNVEKDHVCHFCKSKLIICPFSDHPSSHLWSLRRTDDESLLICPNGCLEDGSYIGNPFKRRRPAVKEQ